MGELGSYRSCVLFMYSRTVANSLPPVTPRPGLHGHSHGHGDVYSREHEKIRNLLSFMGIALQGSTNPTEIKEKPCSAVSI